MNLSMSLVIPCFNEALNIPTLLIRCAEAFCGKAIDLILVDNGSTDETPLILAELIPQYSFAKTIRVEKNQGYGYGILSGLSIAQGDYIGWTHADLQTDPVDLVSALTLINQSDSNLFLKGTRYGRKFQDLLFTVGMSIFDSILLKKVLWDINAQPNVLPKKFLEQLPYPPKDFSFDLYVYYMAKKNKLTIKRFPVFFGLRVAGEAHLSDLKSKLKYVHKTIKYSFLLKKSLSQ